MAEAPLIIQSTFSLSAEKGPPSIGQAPVGWLTGYMHNHSQNSVWVDLNSNVVDNIIQTHWLKYYCLLLWST